MKRSPSSLTSQAPSPRSASDNRNRGAPGNRERRRMELHELEIGDARAGAPRQRDAVAGRDRRIGRLAEDLSGAAGRQQHRAAPSIVAGVARVAIRRARRSGRPRTISAIARVWLSTVHARVGRDARPQQPADLASGRVARVQHAAHAVRALAAERRAAPVAIAIERGAPLEQLADVADAVLHEHAHGVFVAQAVAGGHRVGEMLLRRILGADRGGDAALRVAGVALGGIGLGEDR